MNIYALGTIVMSTLAVNALKSSRY